MLRLSILQSVNTAVLKLNINENRFLTTCMNNLNTSTGTVKTEDRSKLQDTTDFDIDGNVYKQVENKKAVLQEEQRNSKLSKTNELESVNKFQVMVNTKSVSIFGSERVKNCGIQCTNDNDLKIPTVTYILNKTMPPKVKAALESWKENIIDIYGEEYFKTYSQGLLNSGRLFHSHIQMMILRKVIDIPPFIKPIYCSIKPILDDMQFFHVIETDVIHPTLRYKSSTNYIASYRGHTYLIDWKKSREPKTSLAMAYDAPIQVAASIGAINAFNKYSFKINKGLVIIAYTTGEPASIYKLKNNTLQIAWRKWLNRLKQFYGNYNKDSLNTN